MQEFYFNSRKNGDKCFTITRMVSVVNFQADYRQINTDDSSLPQHLKW